MAQVPGERLVQFAEEWKSSGADPDLFDLVQKGHKIKFKNDAPPLSLPLPEFETKLPPEQTCIVRKEIIDLVNKGALRRISYSQAVRNKGFYSKVFAVPKPNGKWRTIINLKPINKFVKKEKFKMDTTKDVRSVLEKGCYAGIVDLTDAYYTVSLHKDSRKYCRFIFEKKIYEFCALPMGLMCSPRVFTRVGRFLAGQLRKKGVILIIYIDDLLVIGTSWHHCEQMIALTTKTLERHGFLLNVKKCSLVPSQVFTYLGMVWNTVAWTVGVKTEREDKIREAAQQLLGRDFVRIRTVAVFLGRVQSTAGAIPLARARCRILQWDFLANCLSDEDYDNFMSISAEVRDELQFWANLPAGLFSSITPSPSSVSVTTDASQFGIGICFNGDLVSEPIPEESLDLHINVKELLALKRWLEVFPLVRDTTVTWRVDNNSALAAIRKQGSTRSWLLSCLSVNILKICHSRGLIIEPVRVSSDENILADAASRFKQVEDWSLLESVARKIFSRWGQADVDLMATTRSRKCPMFYSWSRTDTEAWGTDSLAMDVNWQQFSLPYCFPPFPLLNQVLAKVKEQQVQQLLLVVPWWPGKPFFPILLSMILDCRRIPVSSSLVTDTVTGLPPPRMEQLRLVVCLISGKSDRKTLPSHGQPRNWYRARGVTQPSHDMEDPGQSGSGGVLAVTYSQLLPL